VRDERLDFRGDVFLSGRCRQIAPRTATPKTGFAVASSVNSSVWGGSFAGGVARRPFSRDQRGPSPKALCGTVDDHPDEGIFDFSVPTRGFADKTMLVLAGIGNRDFVKRGSLCPSLVRYPPHRSAH
jgi:hypothetical protein